MNKQAPLLEMKGIVKDFGGLRAVVNVDLVLNSGKVLGLVGENAAGKSTLIKILTGVYTKTAGEIYWEGQKVELKSRADSLKLGIDAIYQNLGLVETLNVPENLFLGKELKKKMLGITILDNKKMERESRRFLKETIGLDITNYRDPIINLSGGQRQAVAIARAIYWDANLVIMDEPTASLGVEEVLKTFEIVHNLKRNNTAVIFICHNLEHVFEVADKIMVLRAGKRVGFMDVKNADKQEIVSLMVGLDVIAAS